MTANLQKMVLGLYFSQTFLLANMPGRERREYFGGPNYESLKIELDASGKSWEDVKRF